MLKENQKKSGYACVPYQHDKFSIDVKDMWISSRNIKYIYFVTATFSDECKPYFPFSANHYLLGKFNDEEKFVKDASKFINSKPTFIFTIYNGYYRLCQIACISRADYLITNYFYFFLLPANNEDFVNEIIAKF